MRLRHKKMPESVQIFPNNIKDNLNIDNKLNKKVIESGSNMDPNPGIFVIKFKNLCISSRFYFMVVSLDPDPGSG
jgi:hypothetical protein